MIENIRKYIEKHQLLNPEGKIILGYSGGADSVALLHILVKMDYSCLAAHCNFHLRGEESDRDQAFAADMAQRLGVDFYSTDFQTTKYAQDKGISIEMAARDLRYEWFEKLRVTHQAQAIAVAHHRDDNAETILLNLLRGSGIRGLCGIRPRNGYVVRPLLQTGKEQILAYLKEENLSFVTDSTNMSDEYTRNFLRLRMIPLLEQVNPSFKKTITHTASILSGTEEIYQYAIKQMITEVTDTEGRLFLDKLTTFPSPQTIIYEWLTPFGFTPDTIESVVEAMHAEPGKRFYSVNRSYVLLKDRNTFILSANTSTLKGEENPVFTLQPDQEIRIPITLSINKLYPDKTGSFTIIKSPDYAYFDLDKLTFPLYLRRWKAGDWFIPFGMKGKKKISDYFSDRKFNLFQKQQIWLLCSGDDIIWLVGERADNRFRVSESTKTVLIAIFSE